MTTICGRLSCSAATGCISVWLIAMGLSRCLRRDVDNVLTFWDNGSWCGVDVVGAAPAGIGELRCRQGLLSVNIGTQAFRC